MTSPSIEVLRPLSLRERVGVRVLAARFIVDDRGSATALTLPSPGGRGC
jgi:hypothetical protein